MEKNKKNEELQSRREFFKKATKSVLPILGTILLASTPAFIKAKSSTPMGCMFGCVGMCLNMCTTSCSNSCMGWCSGTCIAMCSNDCTNFCKGGCLAGCKGSCVGACDGTCSNSCTKSSKWLFVYSNFSCTKCPIMSAPIGAEILQILSNLSNRFVWFVQICRNSRRRRLNIKDFAYLRNMSLIINSKEGCVHCTDSYIFILQCRISGSL